MKKYTMYLVSYLLFVMLTLGLDSCSSSSSKKNEEQEVTEAKTSLPETNKSEFLKGFYSDYVLGGTKNFEEIATDVCTPRLLKYLQDSYEWECPESVCYNLSCFRTDNQDGSDENKVMNVTALEDNWYKVEYLDMGHQGTTNIRFVEDNGVLKMDEIIKGH